MAKRSKPRRAVRRSPLPTTQAHWMAARAKNALRRPVFIGSLSVGTFVVALVALLTIPQQVERAARRVASAVTSQVDTIAPLGALEVARARARAAEDSLVRARQASQAAFRSVMVDTVSPATAARRDTINALKVSLDVLIDRAENVPLPSSYRALGDALAAQGETRVVPLLDSLGRIEREREAFGAVGSADPIYVALTSAATDVGRAIVGVAQARQVALDQQVAAMTPKVETIPGELLAAADTAPRLAARDSARAALAVATAALARARQQALAADAREEQARLSTSFAVPSAAILGAALVLGAVLGFGAAFVSEVRHPRLADAAEAERVTGLRVLGVVQPRRSNPERSRRESDRSAPPTLDPEADAYQLAYLHVATASPGLLILTVTGDEPSVPAIVATNLAAISAMEARHTLVIDGDSASCAVASVLHTRAEPGVVELIDDQATVGEAIQTAPVGRGNTVDVISSGIGVPLPDVTEVSALLQREVGRLARRYDTILAVTSADHALAGLPASLPSPDVLYCCRVGYTKLRTLREAAVALRRAGGNPIGLVVWDAQPVLLPTPTELTVGRRPQRTSEMAVVAKA